MSQGIDPSNLRTYTDAEMVTLYRWAIANGAAGTTRQIGGRSVTFPSVTDMMQVIQWAEDRQAIDAAGDGVAFAEFAEPQ